MKYLDQLEVGDEVVVYSYDMPRIAKISMVEDYLFTVDGVRYYKNLGDREDGLHGSIGTVTQKFRDKTVLAERIIREQTAIYNLFWGKKDIRLTDEELTFIESMNEKYGLNDNPISLSTQYEMGYKPRPNDIWNKLEEKV